MTPIRPLRWIIALALAALLAACGTRPVAPPAPAPVVSQVSEEQAQHVTITALGLVGTPYRYGGNTPQGRFVHAPSTGGQVRMDRLDARHWARQQLSYRRP